MRLSRALSTGARVLFLVVVVCACANDPAVVKQRNLEKAQAYYAKAQYNEAIVELKNALRVDSKFVPAAHLIGRAYAAKSWHMDAMRELKRVVELQPDNVDARVDLGHVYFTLEAWHDLGLQAKTIAERIRETRTGCTSGPGNSEQPASIRRRSLSSIEPSPAGRRPTFTCSEATF